MGITCKNCKSIIGSSRELKECPYCFAVLTNEVSSGDIAVEIKEPEIKTKKQVVRSRGARTRNNSTDNN